MPKPPSSDQQYKVPAIEKAINAVIKFVFTYRLLFVIGALAWITIVEINIWNTPSINRARNFAIVLTGGSIILGIFYSILNYEHNHLKYKKDSKSSKDILTFNTAFRAHDVAIIHHFRTLRLFYNKNQKHLGRLDKFHKKLEKNTEVKTSFISIFNYFECISIGVNQRIMDETFVKEFFTSLFREYSNFFGAYIDYIRKMNKTELIFSNFTALAAKWAAEGD